MNILYQTSLSWFPSFVPPRSFFCGLINIVLSWHYWGQNLPCTQTKTQPNPEIHSPLSQAIPIKANWMLVLLKLHIVFYMRKNTKVKVFRHICLKLMIHMSAFYYIDTHVYKFMYDEDYATAGGLWEHFAVRTPPNSTWHKHVLSRLTPGGCPIAISEINRFTLTDNQHFALPNTCLSSTIDIITLKVHLI